MSTEYQRAPARIRSCVQSYWEAAGNLSPGNWVNVEQAGSTEEVKLND